jgi:hypothetical protein
MHDQRTVGARATALCFAGRIPRLAFFWTIGILIPVAGVVLIAGGGEFGGAGSLIHW